MLRLILTLLLSGIFSFGSLAQKLESIPNAESCFGNLHRINDSIYRSEQPECNGSLELEKLGIRSLLSLRNLRSDRSFVKGTSLKLYHRRVNAWTMTENELIDALKLLIASEKPVLIHCVHGSDRTGAVIAAYRIVFQSWSKEDAIREMTGTDYGFHRNFRNLVKLIERLDVERVKKELQLL